MNKLFAKFKEKKIGVLLGVGIFVLVALSVVNVTPLGDSIKKMFDSDNNKIESITIESNSYLKETGNTTEDNKLLYDEVKRIGSEYKEAGTTIPIYYLNSNNNNVLFANTCWKIVRTTETGGVKLLYNGLPADVNGKKVCNNSGASQQLAEKSAYNHSYNSPAYVGYMYNTVYPDNSENPAPNAIFGNDVTYDNGQYTLTETGRAKDNTHHYTCNDASSNCAIVRYYYYNNYYIELTDGKKIEDALNEMLFNEDVNSKDSEIKKVVDRWYEANILGKYETMLEDTVFCNDRSIEAKDGWDKDGNLSGYLYFHVSADYDLTCKNKTDRFTVSESIGNGKLKYPVGLLTAGEANILGSNMIKTGESYWLMSPYDFNNYNASVKSVYSSGNLGNFDVVSSYGVRPVVSLIPNAKYSEGDGTADSPYVIIKNTPKGKIKIHKVGEILNLDDGNFDYNNKEALKEIEFEIYADEDIKSADDETIYEKDHLVTTITTNSEGYAITDEIPVGKYRVVEVKTNDNYVLDSKEYKVELVNNSTETEIVYNLELTNKLKKGTLEFTKTNIVDGTPIANTKIEIYNDKDELVYRGITNNEGKITIDNLSIGKYYIIEKEPPTGYVMTDEKVYFEIKEDGEVIKKEMKNKSITGTLEFTNVDFYTNDPIPNTLIEIYSVDDEENPIFSGRTDENGMIIIDELEYGKYFIIEKETVSSDYMLNTERMYFEIKEDGKIVKCTMVNELVPIEMPNTGIEDNYLFEIIGGLLILIGLGGTLYVVKEKRI